MVSNVLNSITSVLVTSTKPYVHTLGRSKYVGHNRDLLITFLHIVLVNTYRVYPYANARSIRRHPLEERVQCWSDFPQHLVNSDSLQRSICCCCAPSVRQRVIYWLLFMEKPYSLCDITQIFGSRANLGTEQSDLSVIMSQYSEFLVRHHDQLYGPCRDVLASAGTS